MKGRGQCRSDSPAGAGPTEAEATQTSRGSSCASSSSCMTASASTALQHAQPHPQDIRNNHEKVFSDSTSIITLHCTVLHL